MRTKHNEIVVVLNHAKYTAIIDALQTRISEVDENSSEHEDLWELLLHFEKAYNDITPVELTNGPSMAR